MPNFRLSLLFSVLGIALLFPISESFAQDDADAESAAETESGGDEATAEEAAEVEAEFTPVDQLRKVLAGDDDFARRAAIRDIRSWDANDRREAVPVLAEILSKNKDPQCKLAALEVITWMGPEAEAALPVVIAGITNSYEVWGRESRGYRFRAAVATSSLGAAAVEPLRKMLQGRGDASLVAMALAGIGPDAAPAIPELIELLSGDNEDAASEASKALANIGSASTEELAKVAREGSTSARGHALRALAQIQPVTDSVRVAVAEATDAEATEVRAAAMLASGQLKLGSEQLADLLCEGVGDSEEPVRIAAINVAMSQRDVLDEMTDGLAKLLVSDNEDVSRHAAFLLQASGSAEELLNALRDDRSHLDQIATALASIGNESRDQLLSAAKDSNPRVRRGVAETLGQTRPTQEIFLEQLESFLNDSDESVQLAALDSLSELGNAADRSIPAVRSKLASESPAVRGSAVEALLWIALGDASLVNDYRPLLSDPDPTVRSRTITAMQKVGEASRPALVQVISLMSDPDESVRIAAAEFVGSHGHEASGAIPSLLALLDEGNAELRATVIITLAKIGPPAREALSEFGPLIEDDSPLVRAEVARSLQRLDMDAGEMKPYLAKALRDDDFTVRFAAMETIRAYRGRDGALFVPDLILLTGYEMDRQRLGETLGRFRREPPDAKTIPEFIALLDHERDEVRTAAMEYLARAGEAGKPALEKLEELTSHENRRVASSAKETIEAIKEGKPPQRRRRRGG